MTPNSARADQRRDHGGRAGQVDGLRHHPRVDHVVLDLLVDHVEDHAGDADLPVGGERDRGDDHRADGGADHRDHVEQRDHERQRDGVLPEAGDEQEDQRRDAGAHRDDERAGDVAADAADDPVAELRRPGRGARRGELVDRGLGGLQRGEEVQRQHDDDEAVEQRAEHRQPDADRAAEERADEVAVGDVVLDLVDDVVLVVEPLHLAVALQVVEPVRHVVGQRLRPGRRSPGRSRPRTARSRPGTRRSR